MDSLPSLDDLSPAYIEYNQGPVAGRVGAAMIGLSVALVMLRLAARLVRTTRLGLDDWILVGGLIPALAYMATTIVLAESGLGRHLDVILLTMPGQLQVIELWTFISELTYGTAITAVKLSILAMYDRLFPTKFMRRAVIVLAVLALLWYLAVVFVVFFQCNPIPRAWGGTHEGSCVDHYTYYTGLAVPHILIDVIILSLPIREVRRLQIVIWQKVAVCGMFLLGGFVTVISIIRVKFIANMINAGPGADTTVVTDTAVWSDIEVGMAVVCACLPTLQPLVRKAKHALFGPTRAATEEVEATLEGSNALGSRRWTGPQRPIHHMDSKGSFERLPDPESGQGGPESPEVIVHYKIMPKIHDPLRCGGLVRTPSRQVGFNSIPMQGLGIRSGIRPG